MIRTNSVKLTTLSSAIAYRRKGSSGDAAIVIVRADATQPGLATISKTTGEPIVAANTPAELYPTEAFAEAIELTSGLPYCKQGKPAAPEIVGGPEADDSGVNELEEVVIDSEEYQFLVDAFTDKNGKLSYALMNKQLIQLAHRSTVVSRMIGEGASEDDVFAYVVGARFRNVTGNHDLTDAQVAAMAELIDEVSPKGAFKELRAKIRQMKRSAKRG